MPQFLNTPETLLSRNDSKNPATTCKGITTNGRPCRRALAASNTAPPSPSPGRNAASPLGTGKRGVLAVLTIDDLDGDKAAAFYCWQHKDQAEQLAAAGGGNDGGTKVFPLTKRSSIDTLVDRLGILDLDGDRGKEERRKHRRRRTEDHHSRRRDDLPQAWHDVTGPLMTVPEVALEDSSPRPHRPPPPRGYQGVSQKPRPTSNVKASIFCCVRAVDDETFPPPRQSRSHHQQSSASRPIPHRPQRAEMVQRPGITESPSRHADAGVVRRKPVQYSVSVPDRPTIPSNPSSHTQTLLSLIPPNLSPQTTSLLLQELARPISSADEAGYIYMFWLTPPSNDATRPDDELASTLLDTPPSTPIRNPQHNNTSNRRASDALATFSTPLPHHFNTTTNKGKTVLLKIGRASNVHRRLNQWSRQCNYNLTLIRYYPYQQPLRAFSSTSPQKVPHVHRVERLIHIELADKKAKDLGSCGSCGREHREWFEIQADRTGVRGVDEVVRRWVGWGMRN